MIEDATLQSVRLLLQRVQTPGLPGPINFQARGPRGATIELLLPFGESRAFTLLEFLKPLLPRAKLRPSEFQFAAAEFPIPVKSPLLGFEQHFLALALFARQLHGGQGPTACNGRGVVRSK